MQINVSKITIILVLILIISSLVSPLKTYAEGENFWKDFDVKYDKDNIDTKGANGSGERGWKGIIGSLKNFIVGIAGVATVIAVGFFIFNFMKLGGSNSRTRSEAISGLIYSGIATAGLGSVTLITAMFYGMIGSGGSGE